MNKLEATALTDKGRFRPTSHDRVLMKVATVSDRQYGLFCVADGMGGLTNGGYATSVAVEYANSW